MAVRADEVNRFQGRSEQTLRGNTEGQEEQISRFLIKDNQRYLETPGGRKSRGGGPDGVFGDDSQSSDVRGVVRAKQSV